MLSWWLIFKFLLGPAAAGQVITAPTLVMPHHEGEVLCLLSNLGMVDTFLASLMALFWSMIMLLVCMSIGALVLCESCIPLLQEMSLETAEWVFANYGTFFRSMFTMFEITFSGGWPNSVRPLVDDVSIYFAIPCLLYVVFIVFAALRLITALLVRSTMQAMSNDAAMAVLERQERSTELQEKLKMIFEDGDLDGDKALTLAEWEKLFQHREIVQYLSVLELDVHDAKMLFHMLDDGDGLLTVQEFCEGVPKVKGTAKSLDIVRLMHETDDIRKECKAIRSAIERRVSL
ncbi:Scn10a [Symbiodinium natans]|uniref:Scn10a protein n=1 Tax=Symbiodinium natans TaxID=878477 RepID=A0A812P6C6_9DINO|nr:Scn10a [Symbiodinium natans]